MPSSATTDILLVSSNGPTVETWCRGLSEQGFAVHRCAQADARHSPCAARVLLAPADLGQFAAVYLADTRPTLLVVPEGAAELKAFEFVREHDDVCLDTASSAIIAHRLRRVIATGSAMSALAMKVADWRAGLAPDRIAGVLEIDLDFFSYLNKRWGWRVGNEVLADVRTRLLHLLEPGDRLLPDRDDGVFCLLSAPDPEVLAARAGELQACVGREAVLTSAGRIVVTASAGLALMRQLHPATVCRESDIAVFMAKVSGRNTLMSFDELEQAHQDGLTGLHNRRYFDARFKREISLARNHGTALSLALLDLDDFGLVNKQHGHPAGDRVLRAFAATAAQAIRDIDWIARYGGEEFCVVARATHAQLAVIVERIRQQFAAQRIECRDGGFICMTLSAGVVDCGAGEPEDLLHRASGALRRAKDCGKNQVHVAD